MDGNCKHEMFHLNVMLLPQNDQNIPQGLNGYE